MRINIAIVKKDLIEAFDEEIYDTQNRVTEECEAIITYSDGRIERRSLYNETVVSNMAERDTQYQIIDGNVIMEYSKRMGLCRFLPGEGNRGRHLTKKSFLVDVTVGGQELVHIPEIDKNLNSFPTKKEASEKFVVKCMNNSGYVYANRIELYGEHGGSDKRLRVYEDLDSLFYAARPIELRLEQRSESFDSREQAGLMLTGEG